MSMHRLLKRQVKRYLEELDTISPMWQSLLDAVSSQYIEIDRERELLQNALEVNSRELTEANEQLRIRNREFMQTMLNTLSEGVYAIDLNSKVIFMNMSGTQLLGKSEEEMIGRNVQDIMHHSCPSGESHTSNACPLITASLKGNPAAGEEYFIHQDGHLIPVSFRSNPLERDGKLIGSLVSYQDISVRLMSEVEIHQLAFFDALTNLPNRRLLMDRLEQAMVASSRQQKYGAIVFVDLDYFKEINDTFGHECGDRVLKEVSQRLKSTLRDADTVARLGGDEFVVILENLDMDKSRAATYAKIGGDKILSAFKEPFILKGEVIICTASVGIVIFRGHEETAEEVLKRSDLAMYDAKKTGRNTLCFYDTAMQVEFNNRTNMDSDLRQAIAENQFILYYQKRVNNHEEAIGAEALIRWDQPGKGIVSPLDFIPVAEQTGLIIPIGQWVRYEACRQLKAWEKHDETKNIIISVNVSTKEFRQDDFVEHLVEVLHKTSANASLLELEITESMLLDNVEDTIQKMEKLTKLGISFAMDDFGTGYSSLAYLKKLPIHNLKIDKSFIKDLEFDKNDEAIVKTIIQIGHTLGLEVIAEGVETLTQKLMLVRHGCKNFQGYLFGKPVPVEILEKNLRSAPTRETGKTVENR